MSNERPSSNDVDITHVRIEPPPFHQIINLHHQKVDYVSILTTRLYQVIRGHHQMTSLRHQMHTLYKLVQIT